MQPWLVAILLARTWIQGAGDPNLFVATWGDSWFGGDSTSVKKQLDADIISISASDCSFAAIHKNATVIAWGHAEYGGDTTAVKSELTNIASIASTERAFAALNNLGKVIVWGAPNSAGAFGANTKAPVNSEAALDAATITSLAGTDSAFAGITSEGKVIAWGHELHGGTVPDKEDVPRPALAKITTIVGANTAFAAINDEGNVFSWGTIKDAPAAGGDNVNVRSVVGNSLCFVAINSVGKMFAWGDATCAGANFIAIDGVIAADGATMQNGIVKVTASTTCFAALSQAGKVYIWGSGIEGKYKALNDGSLNDWQVTWDVRIPLQSNIVSVASTRKAFAALTKVGQIIAWGNVDDGGSYQGSGVDGKSSYVSFQGKKFTSVVGNRYAFAALDEGGSLSTWGYSSSGGDSRSVQLITQRGATKLVAYERPHNRAFAVFVCRPNGVTCQCPGNTFWKESWKRCLRCDKDGDVQLSVPNKNRDGCEACPKSHQFHVDTGTCQACAVGKVQQSNPVQCDACDPGKYANGAQCADCPVGKAGEGADPRTVCVTCPLGKVPNSARSLCVACHAGQFANSTSAECVACPEGTAGIGEATRSSCSQCDSGEIPTSGGKYCERCTAGEFSSLSPAVCTPCGFASLTSEQGDSCVADSATLVLFLFPAIFGLLCLFWYIFVRLRRYKTRVDIANVFSDKWHKSRKDTRAMKRLLQRARTSSLDVLAKILLKEVSVLQHKYLDLDYITKIVEEQNMVLVQGEWLINNGRHRFLRKQDLPREGVWQPQDFRRELRMISVVVVSYCWLHPCHPDPGGEYNAIIKHALRLRLALEGSGRIKGIALFFDFMSMAQHSEDGSTTEPALVAMRTPQETAGFRAAMAEVNVLYANQRTQTWILMWVPANIDRSYNDRAWPTFEKAASSMIKDPMQLITLTDKIPACKTWEEVHENRPHRTPPLVPKDFDELIVTKSVTSGKDVDFLKSKYKETFEDVVGAAASLWFGDLGWEDSEAAQIATLLDFCLNLEQLILSGNKLTAKGALVIIKASALNDTLEILDVTNNAIDAFDRVDLVQAWVQAGKRADLLVIADHSETGDRATVNGVAQSVGVTVGKNGVLESTLGRTEESNNTGGTFGKQNTKEYLEELALQVEDLRMDPLSTDVAACGDLESALLPKDPTTSTNSKLDKQATAILKKEATTRGQSPPAGKMDSARSEKGGKPKTPKKVADPNGV